MTATVSLERVHDTAGLARRLRFVVDDQPRAALRRGRRETLDVAPGWHRAYVRLDHQRSPAVTFHVADGETVRLVGAVPFVKGALHLLYRPHSALELDVAPAQRTTR